MNNTTYIQEDNDPCDLRDWNDSSSCDWKWLKPKEKENSLWIHHNTPNFYKLASNIRHSVKYIYAQIGKDKQLKHHYAMDKISN